MIDTGEIDDRIVFALAERLHYHRLQDAAAYVLPDGSVISHGYAQSPQTHDQRRAVLWHSWCARLVDGPREGSWSTEDVEVIKQAAGSYGDVR